MAWDEWEQLKAAAADRHSTHMQLNHLPTPDDQGASATPAIPGTGTQLKSRKATWTKAGQDVAALRGSISKAMAKLEEGQKGLGKESGCLTAGAQHEVHDSWKRYVTAVSKRCGALADILEKTGGDQLKTDDAVQAELHRIKVAYQDTPAIGGQEKGR